MNNANDVWEVYALKYAERNSRTRNDSFILDDNHNVPHHMDYYLWLLKSPTSAIVVDTGYDTAEGIARGRPVEVDPAELLKRFGVAPDTVDTVIVTHLHYDHAGSLPEFKDATFHLQEQEMSYATGPCMCHDALKQPFTGEHIVEMVRRVYSGRVVFHNGPAAVAPGVEVHLIGGHSRGLQCVRVKTRRGWLVLASDASHYYENFLYGKPFPIVVDLEDMLNGFDTLVGLAESKNHVIPGHDPLVRQYYPSQDDQQVFRLDVDPAAMVN